MAEKVALTLGLSKVPHTRALLETAVQPDGIELTCTSGPGLRTVSEPIIAGTIDGGEFSLSSLMQVGEGGLRLCVLPIFLGQGVIHRALWRRDGSGMLEVGEVDGALERYLYTPGPVVQRVFQDYHEAEKEHYRRTHIFPMYHALVLRPEVVEGRPWIIQSLLEAFRESRRRASDYMTERERHEADWVLSVLDDDPYAYRLGDSERRSFRYMNEALVREGAVRTLFEPEEFFATRG